MLLGKTDYNICEQGSQSREAKLIHMQHCRRAFLRQTKMFTFSLSGSYSCYSSLSITHKCEVVGKKAETANGLMLIPFLTGFLGDMQAYMYTKGTFGGEPITASYLCFRFRLQVKEAA